MSSPVEIGGGRGKEGRKKKEERKKKEVSFERKVSGDGNDFPQASRRVEIIGGSSLLDVVAGRSYLKVAEVPLKRQGKEKGET